MGKNIVSLGLLRNGKIYLSKQLAIQGLIQTATNDGVAKLARYLDIVDGVEIVRTIVGFYADASEITGAENAQSSYTVLDIDGNAGDIAELQGSVNEINNKIGIGIDGSTLTEAINSINDKIGSGFTAQHTIADALDSLYETLSEELAVTIEESDSADYAKVYTIYQGGSEIGTINIPKDIFVKSASIVSGTWDGDTFIEGQGDDKAIKIEFANSDVIYVNAKDLVDIYVAGNGISIENNVVSIVIDEESEGFLSVTQNGLKISGIQAAINEAVENAKLIASDGISILDNNKIKVVAAKFSENGINNPISVGEEGILSDPSLNCGFFDYITVTPNSAADIAAIVNPETTDLVITSDNIVNSLSVDKTFNQIVLDGISSNTSFGVSAKSIKINNVSLGGGKDMGNGKVNFETSSIDINGITVNKGSTMYNLFEGNQSGVANKNFVASNVVINDPQMKHNVFNIYSPDNDAEILIKDSSFNLSVDNSNVLRLSNYKNSTGVTVTFEDVDWTYENSIASTDWSWAGLVIYQPAGQDVALNGDISKLRTWKFNFKNCRYNGVVVNSVNFGEHNQVIYGYNINKSGLVSDISALGIAVTFE